MIYATFDADGFVRAFYTHLSHGAREIPVYGEADEQSGIRPVIGTAPNPDCQIPADGIAITEDQWLELLSHPGRRKWQAGEVIPYEPPAPAISGEMVNAERSRRIVVGKIIDAVHVTGTDEDARNLTNLALAAQLRLAAGDTSTVTTYRDGDNVDHELTPGQILSLWQQSSAYVSALYAASWALKALDPIPADFADDSYWPEA